MEKIAAELERFQGLDITPPELVRLYENGEFVKLSERILEVMEFFRINKFTEISQGKTNYINLLIKLILLLVSKENYNIPPQYASYFTEQNATLANLVSITDYKTTDIILQEVIKQQDNFFKILFLYSPANETVLEPEKLFAINPYLASLWLSTWFAASWIASETAYKNIQVVLQNKAIWKHYKISSENFPISELPCFTAFHSTYASPTLDRMVKEHVNTKVKESFSYDHPAANPDFSKILVISANFLKGHAVYKCTAPLFYSLKENYKLSLFHLGKHNEHIDYKLFDDVQILKDDAKSFSYDNLAEILKPGYGTIIYPDISLVRPSLILANLRLAPIQITTYGHPVSTFGSKIDYFIAGTDVEPKENPENHYSERLVMLPGAGVLSVYPDYKKSFPKNEDGRIAVGCVWGNSKFNYPLLKTMKEIMERSNKKIVLHFIGMRPTSFAFASAKKDLVSILGEENIKLKGEVGYQKYMENIEMVDFAVDSFHFGSFNRIVDLLAAGKLVVCQEGDRAYNRFASMILRTIGLGELVAKSREEFIEKTLKLIENDNYRKNLQDAFDQINLKEKIATICDPLYFKKAIDHLVTNRDTLKKEKSKSPIMIKL